MALALGEIKAFLEDLDKGNIEALANKKADLRELSERTETLRLRAILLGVLGVLMRVTEENAIYLSEDDEATVMRAWTEINDHG